MAGSGPRLCTVMRISKSSGLVFRILDENVEIAIIIEYPRIQQLILELFTRATLIDLDQVPIGECSLRILIEMFHVGVCRSAVHVEVILFYVFPMISFTVS